MRRYDHIRHRFESYHGCVSDFYFGVDDFTSVKSVVMINLVENTYPLTHPITQ